ncbi:hypothetical protein SERLA73DRAFT_152782 [Serpula lacrymans var. lacrymans S7.3]|uniref:Uncharacterized protein n=1 Tax=Serpula lacrymans var. lacrymans (strain S7.3) TaxID=936435 RepID=F8PYU9_SERL3|nr:hypothetical protein SERLA73DRAFT_152782 [Serpula lacrymans var. lacrymans S7.3]
MQLGCFVDVVNIFDNTGFPLKLSLLGLCVCSATIFPSFGLLFDLEQSFERLLFSRSTRIKYGGKMSLQVKVWGQQVLDAKEVSPYGPTPIKAWFIPQGKDHFYWLEKWNIIKAWVSECVLHQLGPSSKTGSNQHKAVGAWTNSGSSSNFPTSPCVIKKHNFVAITHSTSSESLKYTGGT